MWPKAAVRSENAHKSRQERFFAAGWGISAAVMIVASRLWLLHLREVEQRADEAERTRDEAAQRRAMEERLRIARELHDSRPTASP
jgi:signal transduction histidine kinase